MYVLLQNPRQLKKLQHSPELIKSAVEELLRYDSPVQYSRRVASEDIEFGGFTMRKSDMVIPIIGAANRDPSQFANPHELDITRTENKHLAFGLGSHFCLGAYLSRVESELAILRLVDHFPKLKLETQKAEYRNSAGFRGLESLMLTF